MIGSPKSLFRVPKVSNRQRRRIADLAIVQAQKVNAILLAVLAQSGGEITVTQGTLDQVGKKFHDLDYVVLPNEKVKGEHIVRLIEGKTDGEKAVAEVDEMETADPLYQEREQSTGEDVI